MPVTAAASLVLVALAGPPASGGAPAASRVPSASGAGAAAGEVGGDSGQERERVTLRLEGPIPAAIATVVESDLRTAFGRRGVELTRRGGGATGVPARAASGSSAAATGVSATAREMVLTVAASSERLDQLVLTLQGAGATTLTRRLSLTPVPADGRVLAVVVAADEMLAASADERRARRRATVASPEPAPPSADSGEEPAPPAPPAPAAESAPETASPNAIAPIKPAPELPTPVALTAVATRAAAATEPWHRSESTAVATFAFDHFSGGPSPRGQTQLGFDVGWMRRVGSRAYGLLAAQGRQGLTASDAAGAGSVETRLLGVRLAAGLSLIGDSRPLWLGVDVGARGGGFWVEGHAPPGSSLFTDHDDAAFVVYADAMLTLDIRLGRSAAALRLAVGGGLPLRTYIARETIIQSSGTATAPPVTAMAGLAFESQAGIVLSF